MYLDNNVNLYTGFNTDLILLMADSTIMASLPSPSIKLCIDLLPSVPATETEMQQ